MKQLKATVIHSKTPQTTVVQVTRRWTHPLYHKILTKKKKFLCQNEMELNPGDKVIIQECRPQSKRKRWQILKKI